MALVAMRLDKTIKEKVQNKKEKRTTLKDSKLKFQVERVMTFQLELSRSGQKGRREKKICEVCKA